MFLEESEEDAHVVHIYEHHAPGELALSIHELVDLENVLGDFVLVKLEQVAIVGLHVPRLLGSLLWIDAEKVSEVAHPAVALIGWSGYLPFTERHYAIEDVFSQLQVLLAVGSQVEFFGEPFDVQVLEAGL